MELALKQRLLGAAVLVALAVTFLPMLVTDPAPAGGASDVPLRVPSAPDGGNQTREMPLVEPDASAGPVLPEAATAVDGPVASDSGTTSEPPATTATPSARLSATTAGGNYAVNFGSYASPADAARVILALRGAQLPGYQEAVKLPARTVYRVRVGPYASQADAEAARLQAARVRDDVGAKVVVLDAVAAGQASSTVTVAPSPAAPASGTSARGTAPAKPVPAPTASAKPPVTKPDIAKPAASTPAASTARPAVAPVVAATAPVTSTSAATSVPPAVAKHAAAAGIGFAIQLGAFANADDATRLRDRARAAGFTAFVEPVRSEHGSLSRVRIGPVADRAEADRLRTQVSAKLGIDGIVRPHP